MTSARSKAPKESDELAVLVGDRQAGMLTRTDVGALFTYDQAYVDQHAGSVQHAVAFSIPVQSAAFEVRGTNLHPFFAGLLPEGLRWNALVRDVKTSKDDLFSLLAACGHDTIGNVSILQPGNTQVSKFTSVSDLGRSSFHELLQSSLALGSSARDTAVAGVQPKLSDGMISLPVRANSKHAGAILKLAPAGHDRLVENEAFFMNMARSMRISTAKVSVVHDHTGQAGLLVQRFDRERPPRLANGSLAPLIQLHQEDACQLLGRYPADKYRLSMSEVAGALEVCSAPMVERLRLLQLYALSYAIANGDLHAKNISIQIAGGAVRMTPIYDLLSTLPYGDETMALKIEGRDKRIKRKDLVVFGERIGVRGAATKLMLATLVKGVAPFIQRLDEIGFEERKTLHLQRSMTKRLGELTG